MRRRSADNEELADRLLKRFGYNEPIFTEEIIDIWNEYSRSRVFQLLKEMQEEGIIEKDGRNVYYFPTLISTGEKMILGRQQLIDRKYIYHGEEIFGYYSGPKLLNGLHLITQMPFQIELVTSNTSAKVRKVKVKNFEITVRKSKVKINKNNVYALMLLEAFTDMRRPLEGQEIEDMREFVRLRNIKEKDVLRYSRHFPIYTLNNILETGLDNVFA